MKVIILLPIYKRPEVLRICLDNLKWFISEVSWDIEVVCVLSPEDMYLKENQDTVNQHGFTMIYYNNLPVSDKMNAGIEWIMHNRQFDYLMNLGSDDLIHPQIERLYTPYIQNNTLFFGITKLFFYELATKKTIHFTAYNVNGAIGAGRMIHSSLIGQLRTTIYPPIGKTMPLYEPKLNCGLDTSSAMMLRRVLGVKDLIIDVDEFPYIVDIKTDTNINNMFEIETRFDSVKYYPSDHLKQYYEAI